MALLRWLRSLQKRLRTQPQKLITYLAAAAASIVLLRLTRTRQAAVAAVKLMPVSELLKAVESGRVEAAVVSLGACAYRLVGGAQCQAALLPADTKLLVGLLHRHGVPYRAQGPPGWKSALVLLVPFAYLAACGYLLHRMMGDQGFNGGSDASAEGGGDGNGRFPAVGWQDVAGLPGVKAAVMEVVDVMQRPSHYARVGARCPRGILLAGPPGTGKTLLARAVATEARVPFLCCTG